MSGTTQRCWRAAALAGASLMLCGCTTLVVPVASVCPIPPDYLKACEAPSEAQQNEILNANQDASNKFTGTQAADVKKAAFDEATRFLSDYSALWINSFKYCKERNTALADMVAACNRNAEAMRPRILRAVESH
jgi:hypothetical protein